ncbi:aspartyl/asparaginyl beta-hydroxylase-like isoform 3-T3 [Anableps anableps]
MQRYQNHGTSVASSPSPAALVEEIHAEEEECEEEQEVFQETEGRPAPVEQKNGKRSDAGDAGGGPKSSVFTWFVVLALLGVWSSVAVVYFDIVDYDSVIARAQEFRMNFSEVLQGKLAAYDTDADGDFDVEDAKVLLGLKGATVLKEGGPPEERTEKTSEPEVETSTQRGPEPVKEGAPAAEETSAAVPLPPFVDSQFVPDDPAGDEHPYEETNAIDTTGGETPPPPAAVLVEGPQSEETGVESGRYLTSSKVSQKAEPEEPPEAAAEPTLTPEPAVQPEPAAEPQTGTIGPTEDRQEADGAAEKPAEEQKEKAKKKKPKLLNKLDKTIKSEIDAAERLRKKGKLEEALKAFDSLVRLHPQSPRVRYGKAQAEDDLAEKLRSNDLLQRAINTYGEAAELPDPTPDLLRAALKRRAERQQFLGRMRGSLATLQKLVDIFPDDFSLKNDLGVAHLLLGDNKGAKKVYEEVLAVAPSNGFAKVHYGFILKAENKIAESIPYLREGLESGEPGTDDGRFYFHLGDALQRVGDDSAYHWYELGHRRGHFASVWQRSLYNVEGLKAQPWWTPQETGYTDLVKMLERNWKTIRDEALTVMDRARGRFLPEEENLREKGEWGQYTLWQQGKRVGNACQGVPKTCSLMERFPEATGCKRGQIKFSVMQPGTHVWPHTGPTNCRLRMHLGLVVPRPGCRIRCTNQTREWEEGKVLIFDDSFEHEVWQEADSYRLIFIVDVWHPELTQYQRQTLSPI